jgi:hypothetical protein
MNYIKFVSEYSFGRAEQSANEYLASLPQEHRVMVIKANYQSTSVGTLVTLLIIINDDPHPHRQEPPHPHLKKV